MSDGKKTFFASLEPRSAMIVGLVAGVLSLGTIGFVVMIGLAVKGNINLSFGSSGGEAIASQTSGSDTTGSPANYTVNVVKADRPKVELFVMSYCPFGLQMEKALLPAWGLLSKRADISIKFVNYAMHGLKEVEENTRQYCLQKQNPDKYRAFLQCFTAQDDYKTCLKQVGISESSLSSCVSATNKEFKTLDKYNDQSTWVSGRYPVYLVHDALNQQYGVQGSPTLVINGAQVEGVSRSPEAVKQAICQSFNSAPEECQQALSTVSAGPGFGITTGTNASAAACGT